MLKWLNMVFQMTASPLASPSIALSLLLAVNWMVQLCGGGMTL